MNKKYLLSAAILGIGVVVSLFIASDAVRAQTPAAAPAGNPGANIQYPVAELGNCTSETACKKYCDDSTHMDACLSFAQAHNLMSADEVQMAKKFMAAGNKGPGGCTSKDTCENYCNDTAHIDECISFAEQNGMMSGQELAEAKKVQAAIKQGVKPPACGGRQACDQYCQTPEHMEECIAFAQAAGMMSPQEAQDSAKTLQAIRKGVKPPACRGKEECDKYCQDSAHANECIAFAEAAGFMTSQEAEMARKTGGKGPGGCTSKESCDAFCNNPANQQTCFSFAKDNGLISAEDLKQMEEGQRHFTEALNQAPPQVLTCLQGAVGADSIEKYKSGALMPSKDIGEKMGQCFGQMNQRGAGGPGEGGNMAPGKEGQFQPGPGRENPGGQMMPPQAGPGGCKTPEECQSFCETNPDACKNFGGPSGQGGPGGPGGGFQGMMQKADVMQGNFPGIPGPGQTQQCPPGANCGPGPNQPMPSPNQPGSFAPGTGPNQQFMQPVPPSSIGGGSSAGGVPPANFQPGPSGGIAPQQFQQAPQQFQPGPTQSPSGGGTLPPPSGGTPPPPPPSGGSLINALKSLLGL